MFIANGRSTTEARGAGNSSPEKAREHVNASFKLHATIEGAFDSRVSGECWEAALVLAYQQ
jgi:hypothetical protein